jgi:multidrug efflux system outer membrane protein
MTKIVSIGFCKLATIAFLALFAGCAVGPNYKRPEATTIPPSYASSTEGWKIAQPEGQLPKGNWWEIFGDAELNHLEIQSIGANQQLKVAVAQFAESRAQLNIARAEFFPTVDFAGSGVRQRISPNQPDVLSGTPIGKSSTYNNFIAPFELGYEVDLWGRVRRSVESARAQTQASEDDMEGVKLSIQTEVAEDYFSLRTLDEQTEVIYSNIYVFRKALQLTTNLRSGGAVSDLDVAEAEAVLKTTEAELPSVALQRAQYQHALAVLVGQAAATFRIQQSALPNVIPLIPAGLPSELLERRPDISAAERRMAAANANIGVATAAFYPVVQFNGFAGFQSVSLNTLVDGPSHIWAVGPTITLPIFEGGRNRAGLELAKSTYDELVAYYRLTVLTAFSEVADNLEAQTLLADQYAAQNDALSAALKELDVANNQYLDGLTTFLNVATAESTALNSQFITVQLRGQQFSYAVGLVKALGGGWQESKQP